MAKTISNQNRRRRRRKKRGSAGVVLTILAIIVIIAAIIAAMTVFFKIRAVEVSGESRYAPGDIIASSQIETGKNMFLFNKFACISRIFAAHPYLDEVVIRRVLPDLVEIAVTECQPIAVLHSFSKFSQKNPDSGKEPIITEKEQYFIIDQKGKLLEEIDKEMALGYLLIEGTSLNTPEVGKYAVFTDELKEKPLFLVLNSAKDSDILQNIGALDLSETYNITFTYYDKYRVRIGTADQLDQKIRYMNLIINEHLSPTDTGEIDVSDTQTARFIKGDFEN